VWADANVVLRLLLGEPADQAAAVERLVRRVDDGELRMRLCPLVIAEVVWVLGSFYEMPSDRVADVLTQFLSSTGLIIEEGMLVIAALRQMVKHNVDFVDAYLAEKSGLAGSPVATFDRDFKRLDAEVMTLDTGR